MLTILPNKPPTYTHTCRKEILWGKGEKRLPSPVQPQKAHPALSLNISSGWEFGSVRECLGEALGSNHRSAKT